MTNYSLPRQQMKTRWPECSVVPRNRAVPVRGGKRSRIAEEPRRFPGSVSLRKAYASNLVYSHGHRVPFKVARLKHSGARLLPKTTKSKFLSVHIDSA